VGCIERTIPMNSYAAGVDRYDSSSWITQCCCNIWRIVLTATMIDLMILREFIILRCEGDRRMATTRNAVALTGGPITAMI
jgi:hypothetical protein